MKIFYACDMPNPAIPSSRLWHNNLFLSLVELGHEVIPFDYDLSPHFNYQLSFLPSHANFIKKNRPKLERELIRQIYEAHSKKHIDVFFSYFTSAFCSKETIDKIRSMGIMTINWFCNASFQFYLIEEIAPAYDYCLVSEIFRIEDYKRIGANPIYCQLAANPQIYRPYDISQDYDATFIGQAYADRPEYIKHLVDSGIDVRVFGSGWDVYSSQEAHLVKVVSRLGNIAKKILSPDICKLAQLALNRKMLNSESVSIFSKSVVLPSRIIGSVLPDEEVIKMYSRSKINLGFSTCGNTHITGERVVQPRLRDFEVPMSGGFYMVEYIKELAEFFEYGKEIEGYSSKEELVDKCKFYLKNYSAREKIRKAGFERAKREHTWQKRMESVFKIIFQRRNE